ncbi:MAG TPA: metalloregulator ArsR/SmtB family transcription factor [Propionicimonas sp.]|jgi:rhodanese-related sulfurtransferase/DNA-binding transcriptional ArsR family regulator
MDGREFKDEVFGHFARVGAALGHAKRVELVDVLAQGERTVESLARQVGATVGATSRHLQVLAAAGLVSRRVEGTSRVYRLADPTVLAGYRALVAVAESRIAEVKSLAEAFFGEVDGARPIDLAEFDELTDDEDVVLVDVRPASEFAAGHVEGAVNIPSADLASRMAELPKDARVVAYCRGPYCVLAATAVHRLREAGFTASRLAAGYPDWAASGRPVAS